MLRVGWGHRSEDGEGPLDASVGRSIDGDGPFVGRRLLIGERLLVVGLKSGAVLIENARRAGRVPASALRATAAAPVR